MKLSQFTEAMPGRFAKSDDTKRAERNAKRRDQRSAERDAEKSKNDKLLDKYWRVFTDMAAQTYPDADPIDACFQKYRDFDMDKLNAAAKKHGYSDPMDYWEEMGDLPTTMEGKKKSPAGGPPCWKGKKIHPTKPTKMKGGKRVNNCIDAGTSESFDPGAEPSHQDELLDIYLQKGEEALADALGLTPEQFDQEINEIGFEHGLHADDDREEIIYKVIDDTISNADIDAYESIEEVEQVDVLVDLASLDGKSLNELERHEASGDIWEHETDYGNGLYTAANMNAAKRLKADLEKLGADVQIQLGEASENTELSELRKLAGLNEAPDYEDDVEEGKWDYPERMRQKKSDKDEYLGSPAIQRKKAERKAYRKAMKAKAHAELKRGKKEPVAESYPMGMDADNNTNVSFNQTKKIGDATLNIHATAKDMAELQKVLQMAGLDPDGAEKHMPEPDSVQVVDVDPMPVSPCGGSTDKETLADMLRGKLQQKLS